MWTQSAGIGHGVLRRVEEVDAVRLRDAGILRREEERLPVAIVDHPAEWAVVDLRENHRRRDEQHLRRALKDRRGGLVDVVRVEDQLHKAVRAARPRRSRP